MSAEGETPNGSSKGGLLFKLRGPLITQYLRPLVYLSRNLTSRIGVVLTSTSALTLIVTFAFGSATNPYLGILVYLILPALFAVGLIFIPVGILRQYWKERREGLLPISYPKIDFSQRELRRTALFVAVMTAINVPIFAVASYRGTVYMESVEFCGQTCHQVMQPEFTAYQRSPHARVDVRRLPHRPGRTVVCEIQALGQLPGHRGDVQPLPAAHSHSGPQPAPGEGNLRAVPLAGEVLGRQVRRQNQYGDDEKNTAAKTVLLLHIGGESAGNALVGIHGRHLGVATYIADRRQAAGHPLGVATGIPTARVVGIPDHRESALAGGPGAAGAAGDGLHGLPQPPHPCL